jgi:hypothetical protein
VGSEYKWGKEDFWGAGNVLKLDYSDGGKILNVLQTIDFHT